MRAVDPRRKSRRDQEGLLDLADPFELIRREPWLWTNACRLSVLSALLQPRHLMIAVAAVGRKRRLKKKLSHKCLTARRDSVRSWDRSTLGDLSLLIC